MRALTLTQSNTILSSFSERLAFAKQRINQLEQYRLQKVLSCCDDAFHRVFSLLPLLFHYNHPSLPGYVENVPSGISGFQYHPFQTEYLAEFELECFQVADKPCFDGLYAMGSIGTVTQTHYSDLDLWLCYSQEFDHETLGLIQYKCDQIQEWAMQQGVEISLFLMNPTYFHSLHDRDDANDEHNGSAQHFLLLDEFYRSAIRLAGKRILWLHIDNTQLVYQRVIQQAVDNGELNTEEWIDFGDFSGLSTNEFFGASLWQLYKGIHSPHKSLIKILLLESYAQTYPKTDLISKKFKHLLLSGCGVSYHFDPYLAMLEQVTEYLTKQNQPERLLCLRRCFYLKASRGQLNPLRQMALARLAQRWQWSETDIELLDKRSEWKVKQVVSHHQMLVGHLLQSYRNLLKFARRIKLDPSILPQDSDFLMRQLYSAFEDSPGKISLINKSGRYDLSEKDLTFIEVSEGVSTKAGWYMLNHAPFSTYNPTIRYVQQHKQLIYLIAWGYFNGLITANSRIHLVNQKINLVKLRQFITDLRLSVPMNVPKPRREDFNHPNEIRHLMIAVNLTEDPTQKWTPMSKAQIARVDPFNLGSSEEGVIGSISIIYRNMWNEVFAQHFEGNEALLKSLKFISHKIYRSSAPPESVNVFCYSHQLNHELQQFVLNVVNRCIIVKTGSIFQRIQPHILEMVGKKWQLVFNQQQELKEVLTDRLDLIPTTCKQIPQAIYAFASEGFLQFFFDDNADGSFDVYVLDKQNKTECYHHCQGAKEDKIKEINRLYAESEQQREHDFSSFNFPQFYQLLSMKGNIVIVPFQSKQHRDFLYAMKEEVCQQSAPN